MLKISHFLVFGILSIFLFACGPTKKHPKSEPPNIVFIMSDDHSYQTLSAYEDHLIQTPNLDRIADDGVKFVNSFVTNSICAPSRAVMLTGKFGHINGKRNNTDKFDGSQPTFPKYLQQAGYQTAIIGKWHLKSDPTGFDYWDILPGQGHYYNPDFITNGKRTKSEGYVTNVITDKSLNWLESWDGDKPFSLLIHHKATHRVWMPDTALLDEFHGRKFELPSSFFDNYQGRIAASEQEMNIADEDMDIVYDLKMLDKEGEIQTRLRDAYENNYNRMNEEQKAAWNKHYDPIIEEFKNSNMSAKELARWKYQRYMEDYLACVRSVDNNVGRVLDYLDEHGLSENTLVVYTSDQGFYMGEHGWFDKRFMYEESMGTPLLMRFPENIETRAEVDELVQNIDYAPTLLDLAGVEIPEDVQGKSMLSLVQKADENWRKGLYYHYYEFPNEHMVKRHYGIRTKRYKLIHFYNDINDWELYDLQKDPNEMADLYGREEYEVITQGLKEKLRELQVKYKDTDLSTY